MVNEVEMVKFSDLTICEFTNHDKITFFLSRTSKFSPFPTPSETCALPFDFAIESDPKNIYYQRYVENHADQILDFLLFHKYEIL